MYCTYMICIHKITYVPANYVILPMAPLFCLGLVHHLTYKTYMSYDFK